MDTDLLSLGTEVAPWQIKDFSVALRAQITKAARQQDCTVAEWLHGHFQRHGIDGQQFEPVKLAAVGELRAPAAGTASVGGAADALATIAAAVTTVRKGSGVPLATRRAINDTALLILAGMRQELPDNGLNCVTAIPAPQLKQSVTETALAQRK